MSGLSIVYGVVICFLLILILIGVGGFNQARGMHRVIVQLRQEGRVTDGTITKLEQYITRRSHIYRVLYEFSTESDKCAGVQAVNAQHFKRLKVGDQVSVSYLPANPKVSRLSGTDADYTSRDDVFIMAIGSIIVGVLLIVLLVLS